MNNACAHRWRFDTLPSLWKDENKRLDHFETDLRNVSDQEIRESKSAGRPAAAPQGGGTSGRVGTRGRRVREPRRRNVEPTGEPKGQGNDQGVEVNKGVDGVPDFSTNITQQL
ncbi:hypothetical protein Tco_1401033 [Tanacetum coccineum]